MLNFPFFHEYASIRNCLSSEWLCIYQSIHSPRLIADYFGLRMITWQNPMVTASMTGFSEIGWGSSYSDEQLWRKERERAREREREGERGRKRERERGRPRTWDKNEERKVKGVRRKDLCAYSFLHRCYGNCMLRVVHATWANFPCLSSSWLALFAPSQNYIYTVSLLLRNFRPYLNSSILLLFRKFKSMSFLHTR